MKEVCEDSILSRYFKGKRPMVELLEVTFQELMNAEDDDALKMAYLLMVFEFFETDEGQTSVPIWLWFLVEDEEAFLSFFLWGSYIFDVTLFWLKNAFEKHLN
ncbi:hypothetical protein Ddye_016387 [Dipteronia dyeriana]|uniref:Uncharacterized protein n=1 Tax=Dipteronia dyeriana TaxID=168575 RepID=A0AAD9U7A6_9ROSI|nr:hypothetical protein Ddye_016387 [Dipteronia dyeriana]